MSTDGPVIHMSPKQTNNIQSVLSFFVGFRQRNATLLRPLRDRAMIGMDRMERKLEKE